MAAFRSSRHFCTAAAASTARGRPPVTLSSAYEKARGDPACAGHIAAYGACVRAHGIDHGGGGGIEQGVCDAEYDRMHACFMDAYRALARGGGNGGAKEQ